MLELELRQEDARLVYLAVAYHLGRPGSELDPLTKRPVEHGMAEVSRDLQPQLRLAVAKVSLRPNQVDRLTSAMLGSINELKTYPMLPVDDEGRRRSSVRGFDASLRHMFPEVDEDAGAALDVAEQMMTLKRRLEARLAEQPKGIEEGAQRRRGWWPFGRG